MGEVPELIRAMAALGGVGCVGAAVKVFLVAMGTGVGERRILWGSENSSYDLYIINDNSRTGLTMDFILYILYSKKV